MDFFQLISVYEGYSEIVRLFERKSVVICPCRCGSLVGICNLPTEQCGEAVYCEACFAKRIGKAMHRQRSHRTACKAAKNMCFSGLPCEAEKAYKKFYQILPLNSLAKPHLAWRKRFGSVLFVNLSAINSIPPFFHYL